jgi:hypothetical protein
MDSSSQLKKFKLDIKKAFYYEYLDSEPVPVDIKYMMFRSDGEVFTEGSDEVGQFKFTGEFKNGFIYLKKDYIGQHKVYYLGKLVGNSVKLIYAFDNDWEDLEDELNDEDVEIMAEIEFVTTPYKLHFLESGVTSWKI